eukprot:5660616-Lingulodinium_polyedra.AAC.1
MHLWARRTLRSCAAPSISVRRIGRRLSTRSTCGSCGGASSRAPRLPMPLSGKARLRHGCRTWRPKARPASPA